LKKAGVLLLVLALLAALAAAPPVRTFLAANLPRLKDGIRASGPWAPVTFVLVVALLVGTGLPRLAFHFIGGAVFGFWGGLGWSYLGVMLGYSAVFHAVRQFGLGNQLLHRHPAWQKLAAALRGNSVPAVILFRQLPLPGLVANTILGLSPMRRREFLLGTTVGLIPEAIPATLLGAGISKERLGHSVAYLLLAVVLFAVAWLGWGWVTRRLRQRRGAAGESW
jgi:uncharacterized membrane protein YdjX (TVP38/TMEM64 family)